jgi:hypothetical protein
MKNYMRRTQVGLVAVFVVTSIMYIVWAWVIPNTGFTQQIGVGGTTLSLQQGQTVWYAFNIKLNQKVIFEAQNFIGTVCLRIKNAPDGTTLASACSSTSPVRVEYTASRLAGDLVLEIQVVSTPTGSTSMKILYTKYNPCIWGWCKSNDGLSIDNPEKIIMSQIEGSLSDTSTKHYYRYYTVPHPTWSGYYFSFVASIIGGTGTNYDLAIYDVNKRVVARAVRSSYPDYTYVEALGNSSFVIEISLYSAGSQNEYNLQVGRPLITDFALSTTSVKPGQEFTIYYKVNNRFTHSLSAVLGASIVDSTNKVIHSPQYDRMVTLQSGVYWYERKFYVPKDALLGTYKIELGLWGAKTSDGKMKYLFDYLEKSAALTVSVPKNPEITYYGASPSRVAPGDSLAFTVKWIFYKAYPSGSVVKANAFGDWAKTQQLCVIYDGVDGNYGNEQSKSCTITLPTDISVGTHYIRAGFCYANSFASSFDDLARCTYVDIPITVQKVSTSMTISPSSFSIKSGESVTFRARLVDASGNPLSNKLVTWSSNVLNCNPLQTYTDGSGYVSTTCTAPTVSSTVSATVVAAFGGDYKYAQSSVTASGTVSPQVYSVTVNPNGGKVLVDGSPITVATTYQWAYGSTHTLQAVSPYEPSAGVRLVFVQWSDGVTANPRTITVTGPATYSVVWKRQYALTISVYPQGGGSTNPAVGTYYYDAGSTVTVSATPAPGYTFDYWELDGVRYTTNPITVSMNAPRTLKAVFKQAVYSVTVNPNGGKVLVDGSPITVATTYQWAYGSTHTLQAVSPYEPSAGVRLVFVQWSDGVTANPRTITVTGPATYSVVWKRQYALTISVYPQGGGSTNPAVGTYYYDAGSTVTVSATPAPGYTFDYWELDGVRYTTNPITVSMNAPRTLKAVFKQATSDVIVVARGVDSRLYYRACLVCDWIRLSSGATPDAPAAVIFSGNLYIAVRGNDNGIYVGRVESIGSGNVVWQRVSGATFSRPAVATDGVRLYLVVRGLDDRIYINTWDGSSWSGWIRLSSGATPDAPAAVVLNGRLHIVVRGLDNGIYHGQYDIASGTWLGWIKISGLTPSAPALVTDGARLYLVVRGMDNRVYVNTWNGGWGTWERIPTGSTPSGPAATWYNGKLYVVVRGGDNRVYYTYRTGAGIYASWVSLGGTTYSSPGATSKS